MKDEREMHCIIMAGYFRRNNHWKCNMEQWTAKKVKMTAMPEMVSLFNGMGGACAALISIVEFSHFLE